jgi:hypothetical protein
MMWLISKETMFNGLCMLMFVFIGAMTSMGLLGVDPNTLNDKNQICKHHEQQSTLCKKR